MATDSKAANETVQSCDIKEASESIDVRNGQHETKTSNTETKPTSNEQLETANSHNKAEEDLSNEQPPTDTCNNQTKGIEPKNSISEEAPINLNGEVYNYLKNLLETNLSKDTDTENTQPIPIDTQLRIALQFLNTGESGSTENVSHCLTNLINCLIEVAPQFIKFPGPLEAADVQQQFYHLGEHKYHTGFPNVLGAIDCTHIHLQTPSTRPEIYVNRQSHHSINVQIVCGPDLQIYNALAAFPGGMDDACIWQCSNLRHVVSESDVTNGWLIGDLNYPQEPWLMTPLTEAKAPAEKLYNKIHALTWNRIKKCIRLLKSRFVCLQTVLNYEPRKVCAIVTACCVLHNICLQCGDVEINLSLKRAQICEDKQIITVDSMEEGEIARTDLIKSYFSSGR